MPKSIKKKRTVLFGVYGFFAFLATILLLIFLVFPYELPRELCISDSSCKCAFYRDRYQCTNVLWRPASSAQHFKHYYTTALPYSLNRTCFDSCFIPSGGARECKEDCTVNHVPEAPECRCMDFHCKVTDSEYPEHYCTVDGKNHTRQEYYNMEYELTKERRPIKRDLGFDLRKEEFIRCKCYPKEDKNKFVVIMKKDSQYYSKELKSRVDEYFESVEADVGVENIGFIFFEGDYYDFQEKLHNLYLEQDVAYVLIIGNDLLEKVSDFHYIGKKTDYSLSSEKHLSLARVTLRFEESDCPTVVVATLPYPPNSAFNEQKQFLLDQLDKYVQFHRNPEEYLSRFSRSYLRIVNLDVGDYNTFDASSPDTEPDIKYHWDLPKRDILSYDPELKSEIREEKPMILEVSGHGWTRILAWQVINSSLCVPENMTSNPMCMGTTDEWLNYAEDFTPALFVSSTGCGGGVINDYNSSETDASRAEFCCWPQTFLKGGALAYISESHPRGYDLTGSEFFGQAIRTTPFGAEYAGDLFLHL